MPVLGMTTAVHPGKAFNTQSCILLLLLRNVHLSQPSVSLQRSEAVSVLLISLIPVLKAGAQFFGAFLNMLKRHTSKQ